LGHHHLGFEGDPIRGRDPAGFDDEIDSSRTRGLRTSLAVDVVSHGETRYLRLVPETAPDATDRVDKLPIKMLNDRILVKLGGPEGERRSSGGILIPATAQMSKRLTWAEVVAVGPNVRAMEPGDQVLFNPEDRYEVEVRGDEFIILRERDVHAVAAKRLEEGSTGLYL
jgi:chaperonin GroES